MTNSKRNQFGLTERDFKTIRNIIENYPEIIEVQLFGSRAKGTYKYGSDIDLAIIDKEVSSKAIAALISDFEESSLPYRVDLINYSTLTHQPLIEHINSIGIKFL